MICMYSCLKLCWCHTLSLYKSTVNIESRCNLNKSNLFQVLKLSIYIPVIPQKCKKKVKLTHLFVKKKCMYKAQMCFHVKSQALCLKMLLFTYLKGFMME